MLLMSAAGLLSCQGLVNSFFPAFEGPELNINTEKNWLPGVFCLFPCCLKHSTSSTGIIKKLFTG